MDGRRELALPSLEHDDGANDSGGVSSVLAIELALDSRSLCCDPR